MTPRRGKASAPPRRGLATYHGRGIPTAHRKLFASPERCQQVHKKSVHVSVHVRVPKRAHSANLSSPATMEKPPEFHGFRGVPGVPVGIAKQALSQLSYGP
jgi:hypothetical protein